MALEYTITELPAVWPGKQTVERKKAQFKTRWLRTMQMLDRETKYLGASKIEFALALRGHWDLRQDGQLRSDARPGPSVIVSFIDRDGQRQAYPCDRFLWWQDNLYAIAVVLEDLRKAERYGVQASLIRAGFKALPAPGKTTVNMTVEAASAVVSSFSEIGAVAILVDRDGAKNAIRIAVARTHPDKNAGDRKYFDEVATAKKVLEAHHGGPL